MNDKEFQKEIQTMDSKFEELCEKMETNDVPLKYNLRPAYQLAKRAHINQRRETGGLYLEHPLAVATKLFEIGCTPEVVSAALLHDVVEDTKYNIDYIKDKFGDHIAKIVDAVTSIDKDVAEEGMTKDEVDNLSLIKMLEQGTRDEISFYALYVKMADRIHNLQTIDCMSEEKRKKKVEETREIYLKVIEKFSINCFKDELEDQCWRVENLDNICKSYNNGEKPFYNCIKERYENMIEQNRRDVSGDYEKGYTQLAKFLSEDVIRYYSLYGDEKNTCRIKVHKSLYTPHNIKELIKNKYGLRNDSMRDILKMISKHNMPLFNIIAVYSNKSEIDCVGKLVSSIVKAYNYSENEICKSMSIIDIQTDDSNRINFYFEDEFKNVYRLILIDRDSYINYNYGSLNNTHFVRQALRNRDSIPNATDLVNSSMKIFKMDKVNFASMPKGSTVLDFAFELHEEIGLCSYGAIVNGVKVGLDKELNNGDVVEILTDTSRDEQSGERVEFKPHAELEWFKFLVTEKGKAYLIKYLKSLQH